MQHVSEYFVNSGCGDGSKPQPVCGVKNVGGGFVDNVDNYVDDLQLM